jgi:hypothetical protein
MIKRYRELPTPLRIVCYFYLAFAVLTLIGGVFSLFTYTGNSFFREFCMAILYGAIAYALREGIWWVRLILIILHSVGALVGIYFLIVSLISMNLVLSALLVILLCIHGVVLWGLNAQVSRIHFQK